MTFNTGNPIGSTDARDRSDNSENLDLAVNSLSQTFVDRLGVTRDTLEGIYQKSAYYRAGTFDAGYTLTNNRQTLAYGNVEYSWSGAFPKVVPAGSTPATSGGIGALLWVDRTDLMLRNELIEGGPLQYLEGGRFALRDIISISDYAGGTPDYDIATRTINTNNTQALKDAMAAARLVNGHVLIPDAPSGKAYYFNETIYPHAFSGVGTNPSGYYGPLILGSSRHGSFIVFDVPAGKVGLHIFGTSGGPSNLGYKNLTIRPHVDGVGIGVCEQGPCVIEAENCDIQNFEVNLKLSNGMSPGIFTEFGTHRRLWLKNATVADLQFRKDGGDASFHGANFEHIIINTKAGANGIDIGTGCNIYNSTWHMNLFAASGVTFISNAGARSGVDAMFFEGDGTVINSGNWVTSGHWRVENSSGVLSDTSSVPFCVSSYITPQAPADSNLTSLGVTAIEATKPFANSAPSNDLFRLRGNNVEAVAYAGYAGGTSERQGFAMCSWVFGNKIKDILIKSMWHLAGITSFVPAFKLNYNGQSGTQLSINSTGFHTGQQGRTASATISANAGVSQVVSFPGSNMPVAGKQTLVSLRLTVPGAAHDTSYLYAVASNPYGSSSTATLISSNAFVTGSGFVAPSSVQMNSSGLFQFNVTTSLNLTASLNIVGIGVY